MILLYILGALLGVFLLYVLLLGVCSLLVDPEKEYNKNSSFYRFLLDSATAAAIKLCRIRLHVSGMEKIPKDTKLLFVSNHRSNFDPLITWYALKKWKLAFISKPENFKIPFFGRIIRRCCFLPIDRENPRKAIVTINRAAKLLKKQEVSIGVYPEGTRSKLGNTMLEFHGGSFRCATKSKCAILPVALIDCFKVLDQKGSAPVTVQLHYLKPIPYEEFAGMKATEVAAMVKARIDEAIRAHTADL